MMPTKRNLERDEISFQDRLDDPAIRLLRERDGVRLEDLTDFLALARKRLLAERWHKAR